MKNRDFYPVCKCLIPYWLKLEEVAKVYLTNKECEAIRLKDIQWFSIVEWAKKMWVSKSTFSNLRRKAHKKLAEAIIFGKWIILGCEDNEEFDKK